MRSQRVNRLHHGLTVLKVDLHVEEANLRTSVLNYAGFSWHGARYDVEYSPWMDTSSMVIECVEPLEEYLSRYVTRPDLRTVST